MGIRMPRWNINAIFGLLLASVFGAWAVNASADPVNLRLMTFNIYNRPWERQARLKNAAALVREQNPDILSLQEVATGIILAGDPMTFFSEALSGYQSVRFWHEQNLGLFKTGLALFSRFPILEADYHEFKDHQFWDYKGFAHAKVSSPAGPLNIIALHLAATKNPQIKLGEFGELAAFIERLPKGVPVLILGDFNEEADSSAFEVFRNAIRAVSVDDRISKLKGIKSWTPDYRKTCSDPAGERDDYILLVLNGASKKIDFTDGDVIRPRQQPNPSDHCPLAAKILIKD